MQYQSGFRTNHSTDTCLSYLNDKILKGFDGGEITRMILIDLHGSNHICQTGLSLSMLKMSILTLAI